MHLRVAHPAPGARRLAVFLVAALLAAACGRNQAPAPGELSVDWRVDPAPPSLAEGTRVLLTLRDSVSGPVTGARLKIVAHMAMPGMSPYLADTTELGSGVYEAPVRFSMRGDWIVVVEGTLADGRRVTKSLDIRDVR
jgi:hypothetical protein